MRDGSKVRPQCLQGCNGPVGSVGEGGESGGGARDMGEAGDEALLLLLEVVMN